MARQNFLKNTLSLIHSKLICAYFENACSLTKAAKLTRDFFNLDFRDKLALDLFTDQQKQITEMKEELYEMKKDFAKKFE